MRKIFSLGNLLFATVLTISASDATASIPLAGIYEMNDKADMSKHQMYLELDFINSRPDFTQTFTGKRAEFKLLPSDFMRAKKLSRKFKGTTAPGFGKYRHHMLFSSSEEFRITNPRLKRGIILVDWENTLGNKGEAIIIPNPDGSLVTYGLTTFDRLIGPDGHKLTLVRNLLTDTGNGGGNGDNKDKNKPETIQVDSDFAEEIKTICAYPGVPDAIRRLRELPDDNAPSAPASAVPSAPAASAPTESAPASTESAPAKPKTTGSPEAGRTGTTSGGSKPATASANKDNDTFNTFVSNDGSSWKGHMTMAKLGRDGMITASATFSDGGNGTVIMNMSQDIAPGDCHVYHFEYIYYGKVVGNSVVFDKITVTQRRGTPVPNAQPKPIPKNEPNVITLLSPTTFDFAGMKFHKLK